MANSEQAQRALFKRLRGLILRIAYKQLGPKADLDEAVQEIFIQVFKSLRRFKGNCQIETWAYRIGINVCTDIIRKKLKKRKISVDGGQHELLHRYPDKSEGALDKIITDERAGKIYGILDSMEERKRTVLVLHDIDGFSLDEISSMVEVPVGTVKSRLHYARTEFKNELTRNRLEES